VRPEREFKFAAGRSWAFDLAYPQLKLAVEVNGADHLRHKRHREDCEKLNAALAAGWRVLQYPASSVLTKCKFHRIVEQIGRVLCSVHDPDSDWEILTGKAA
jgi:very-short-patch-repair endonuclease